MKTYTTADIFPLLIKFLKMTRPEERNEVALKNNLPRLYRFQRLQALAKAFNLNGGIDSLLSDNRQSEIDKLWLAPDYFKTLEKHPFIVDEYKRLIEKGVIQTELSMFEYWDLVWMYYFRLARNLESLKEQTREIKMGIFIGELCIDIIDSLLSEENQKHIQKVYRMLGLLIDPTEKQVTLDELVQNFNFPDVDLVGIDLDYY